MRWFETVLGTWTTESEPSCQPVTRRQYVARHCIASIVGRTSEEQLLSGAEESLLGLRIGNRIEAADAHDLANCVPTAVVGI